MYCTDVIRNDYESWNGKTTVLLQAPTGTGKTTFILKRLLPYAIKWNREILYLSNRKMLHQQLIDTVCDLQRIPKEYVQDSKTTEFHGITFMTYQALQEQIKKNGEFTVPHFFYLVADEVHYLVEDSNFNPMISYLKKYMDQRKCAVFMAMSATMKVVKPYLIPKGTWRMVEDTPNFQKYQNCCMNLLGVASGRFDTLLVYDVSTDSQKYQINLYETSEDIVEEINADVTDEKWIIFQSNKEKASKRILDNIECTKTFLTAESKEDDEMQTIINDRKFQEKVLVTTKVLDNGVSLEDAKIKKIVLDTTSETEFIQMLGRRRKVEVDETVIELFIPKLSAEYFSTILTKQIYPALRIFRLNSDEVLEEMLNSDESYKIIRKFYTNKNGRLVLNEIARGSLRRQADFYEKMEAAMKINANAFIEEQLSWISDHRVVSIRCIGEERKEKVLQDLEAILTENLDKEFAKEEQSDLRQKLFSLIIILCPERFHHKERLPGLNLLNSILEEWELPFRIESTGGKRKGEKSTWTVQRV